jgi:hypothetical protein
MVVRALFMLRQQKGKGVFIKKITNNKVKNHLLVFILLAMSLVANSQFVTPSTINAVGGSGVLGSATLEWNVGESIVATFLSNSGGSITSGQLQPLDVIISVEENVDAQIILFPVPARHELTISAAENLAHVRMYDTTGRLVLLESPNQKQTRLDVSAISAGMYQVVVYNSRGQIIFNKSISKVN